MVVRIRRDRLDIGAAYRELADPGSGGVVVFVGRTRSDAPGRRAVVALEYDVHESVAIAELRRLEKIVTARWNARRVVIWHRTGRVRVGDASVIVGVASAHRSDAFAAARWAIDRIKTGVPIWKVERRRPARRPRSPRGPRAARRPG